MKPEERFPLVEIKGGPHGYNMEMSIDGVPVKGLTKFVLRASTKDVAVLYTRQIVRFAADVTAEHDQEIVEDEPGVEGV